MSTEKIESNDVPVAEQQGTVAPEVVSPPVLPTETTTTVKIPTATLLSEDYRSIGKSTTSTVTVDMPSATTEDTLASINKTPNVNVTDTEEGQTWSDALNNGITLNTFKGIYGDTLNRPSSSFKQYVEYNGVKYAANQPTLPERSNGKVSGERGVMRIMEFLGNGTVFRTPLWHSGMWITFKAPTEAAVTELHRIMVNDKITFGRQTYGLAFSNVTAYMIDRLVDFALSHIYETSVKEELSIAQYKELIACQDIPTLVWGITATMYPKGFNYRRACITDPVKCNHVIEELLNISRLQWIDSDALTDWQKAHMSHRGKSSRDVDSIKRYQDEMLVTQSRTIDLTGANGKSISLTIKTPSIAEHVTSGYKWISGITDTVLGALGESSSNDDRNKYITRHAQATVMRQFAHWVKSVEFNSNLIEDRDTLEQLFDTLSADDNYRDSFADKVIAYIDDSTISVIGIPTYDCPACTEPQVLEKELPRYVNVLPLDVNQLFFALAVQMVSRLVTR